MKLDRDIAYRPAGAGIAQIHSLDIYYDKTSAIRSGLPIVVFIHGGSWKGGDKNCFHSQAAGSLPAWFVSRGYLFASLNFSLPGSHLTPDATIHDQLTDIARALKWLSINGRRYGGRAKDRILFGFSSGAHLASLLLSDPSYLDKARVDRSTIKGAICVDVAQYDVPRAMAQLEHKSLGLPQQPAMVEFLKTLMGNSKQEQERWSPTHFIGPHLSHVYFLLLSAGNNQHGRTAFSRQMSEEFRESLSREGIRVRHRHFEKSEHTDFVEKYEGPISREVAEYLERLEKTTRG